MYYRAAEMDQTIPEIEPTWILMDERAESGRNLEVYYMSHVQDIAWEAFMVQLEHKKDS